MTATDYGTAQQRVHALRDEREEANNLLRKIDHDNHRLAGAMASSAIVRGPTSSGTLRSCTRSSRPRRKRATSPERRHLKQEWEAAARAGRRRQRVQAYDQHLRKTPEKDWPPEDWYGRKA